MDEVGARWRIAGGAEKIPTAMQWARLFGPLKSVQIARTMPGTQGVAVINTQGVASKNTAAAVIHRPIFPAKRSPSEMYIAS
jgi:hypothetical protein